jgi:diketogulonate reductase-like aldo/keto reductase
MDRRDALRFLAAGAFAPALLAHGEMQPRHVRQVPATGEWLPVIGLGTWLTFDVGDADTPARKLRGDILRAFLAAGGEVVDSSPMYGSAEAVIGAELARDPPAPRVFSATKVWTVGGLAGRRQMEHSLALWRLPRVDLMQVHNLLDWETHWPTLEAWKAQGRARCIGMTTSHGRRHDELEALLRRNRMDFVQFTYNLADRQVERVLLPLAAERGTAVIINRPFDGGDLFGAKTAKPLPGWSTDLQCRSWAEAFLKWVVSHPAVTCAIPATSRLAHLAQNVRALTGPLPDAALRRRIAEDYAKL